MKAEDTDVQRCLQYASVPITICKDILDRMWILCFWICAYRARDLVRVEMADLYRPSTREKVKKRGAGGTQPSEEHGYWTENLQW